MKKNITISDVANHVGLSKTTISRYLNGHFKNMSLNTKNQIEKAIAELNYRPNKQAQSLKSKKSFLIGVVVADISNMYSSLLLKGIGNVLGKANYQMIIMDAANSHEQELVLLSNLIDQRVDGIILQASSKSAHNYAYLKELNIPIILVDRAIEPLIFPLVTTNNKEVTKEIVKKIIKKNYGRIVFFSESIEESYIREIRYTSVKKEISNSKCELMLIEKKVDEDVVPQILPLINDKIKTAFFASNGRMLMEILTILHNLNMNIPNDVGVTGFDDWSFSSLVGPGITSIEQKTQEIGETVALKMLSYLEGQRQSFTPVIIKADIQIRKSL